MICNVQKDYVFVQVPEVLFDMDKLSPIADKYYYKYKVRLKLRRFKADIQLKIRGENAPFILKKIFSEYNNIDINFLDSKEEIKISDEPLVSCIILLNMNDIFVRDLTIPSIIFNSKGTPIEIIVVNNGTTDTKLGKGIKVINSEKYNIPKAYNNAVKKAKGKYIAFFHDDCFLSDEEWVDKALDSLNGDVIAVGPEYHKFIDNEDYILRRDTDMVVEFQEDSGGFLKEVPLVIKKSIFESLGGFPDTEILGQEDIFLHKNILKSDRKNLQIDIKNYHFEGISTILLFSTENDLIKNLCSNFVFSKEILIGMIRYGLGRSISERIDYCNQILKDEIFDHNYSPFCDEVSSFGDADRLDTYNSKFYRETIKTKKFIDGSVRVFVSVEDSKCLDILNGLVNLNEVLFNYLRNRILFNYERKGNFQYL